jgi:hypothetical protein
MIRNEFACVFLLFGDEAITRKKKQNTTETLHHALRAMMQFPSFSFWGDTPSPNKKINSFLNTLYNCIWDKYSF